MQHVASPTGISLSYEHYGSGPPLVLVHGGFDDHRTNWVRVKPLLSVRFTVYAVARRGRGETEATEGHSVDDEAADIAALIERIGEAVFLLGHSYGAQVALAATARFPHRVRKLVLYEPPLPETCSQSDLDRLEVLAQASDWDGFVITFFRRVMNVPAEVLDKLRATDEWSPIVAAAEATLGDIRSLCQYDFDADRFRDLRLPVLLQVGTESPRELFATDALAAALPEAQIEELPGQTHEAMQTAPELYVESVARFLLS
jgi:pimeloyl-ACP methyl ester carboxylesterase